ncbi:TIGR04076 family protein [Candidatus Bipolaricaulota bacterium]|nr:TIGR04076 family protein [Candidatus Bipolaricaulota bacterium]
MAKLKITVLERTFNKEIAELYGSEDFKAGAGFGACPHFKDGQTFVLDGLNKSDSFCDRAWADIHGAIRTVAFGGAHDYVTTPNSALSCCTNGMRPVIFKIDRIDSSQALDPHEIPEK